MTPIELTDDETELILNLIGNEYGLVNIGLRPQAPELSRKMLAELDALATKIISRSNLPVTAYNFNHKGST